MTDECRIDSITFDIKQSLDDLANEVKLIIDEMQKLKNKVEILEAKVK